MGGEPLMLSQKMVISYILKNIEEKGYRANIVTNGVDITSFIPYIKSEIVDHVQITIDGTKEIHDKRRIFHDGKGSFDLIIANLKEVLENGIKTYLRVNVDNENINNLPKLADLLIENFSDFTYLFPYIYILQDGGCSGEQNVINEEKAIKQVFELERNNKNIKIFHKRFHPAEFIESIINNKIYQPVLRHCGASRNQFILDYKGNIYKCWHGIGNGDYKTGTFGEKNFTYNDKDLLRKNRNVTELDDCNSCKYRYICGTGCPAAKHGGGSHLDIDKPNCVDYEKLIKSLILEYIT